MGRVGSLSAFGVWQSQPRLPCTRPATETPKQRQAVQRLKLSGVLRRDVWGEFGLECELDDLGRSLQGSVASKRPLQRLVRRWGLCNEVYRLCCGVGAFWCRVWCFGSCAPPAVGVAYTLRGPLMEFWFREARRTYEARRLRIECRIAVHLGEGVSVSVRTPRGLRGPPANCRVF